MDSDLVRELCRGAVDLLRRSYIGTRGQPSVARTVPSLAEGVLLVAAKRLAERRPNVAEGILAATVERVTREASAWKGLLAYARVASHLPAPRDEDDERALGLLIAPALVAFALHIRARASELGIESLYFLSREGLTLQRVYRTLKHGKDSALHWPKDRYLLVSRGATFLPSMRSWSWNELLRFMRQYRRQSLRTLFTNLTLPLEPFVPFAAEHGLHDVDRWLRPPQDDPAFAGFLADPRAAALFAEYRDAARARLRSYLRQQHFFDCPHVGLVDIGWKASMQDNLGWSVAECAERPALHGFYLGYAESGMAHPPKSEAEGFLVDSRRRVPEELDLFRNSSVFEMATTPHHGTVVGYRAGRARKTLSVPVVVQHPVEEDGWQRFFRRTHETILGYATAYSRAVGAAVYAGEQLRPWVVWELGRTIRYPTLRQALRFLEYAHVESFGVSAITTYEFAGRWHDIMTAGSPLKMVHALHLAIDANNWSEAVVRRANLPMASFVFDGWYTWQRTRGIW
jgi:hypothetical protein